MSTEIVSPGTMLETKKMRVMAFIDGFNLYHALDKFDSGTNEADKLRYRKYKWLCLTSLVKRFVAPLTEELVGIQYFTTYPDWSPSKKLRHQTYVTAQIRMGVQVTFGEFKPRTVICRASCLQAFTTREEKQTDINIAVAMIDCASKYDKLILLTADSDQVPSLNLLKKLYPGKILASLPPIGRKAKELKRVCHQSFKMTEDHLKACQLPNPFPLTDRGKQYGVLIKPPTWA